MEKTTQRFSDKMFVTLCERALGKHFSLLNYSIAGWLEHLLFIKNVSFKKRSYGLQF